MSSELRCFQCGAMAESHYTFCIKCGQKLIQNKTSRQISPPMYPQFKKGAQLSTLPYPTRRKASINYKLLGLGIIFMIIITIGGIYLFSSFMESAFRSIIDMDGASLVIIDNEDNIIVIGLTNSVDFPSTFSDDTDPNETSSYWLHDCFVSKFSSEGDLIWSRIIGGSENEYCYDAVIDTQNNIILTGITESIDFLGLEIEQKSYLPRLFIIKLSPNGTILWNTSFEEGWEFESNGIAVDSQDNIIITGSIVPEYSNIDAQFHNITNPSSPNIVVMKMRPNGTSIWNYLVGGSSTDHGMKIKVDSNDDLIIVGETISDNFPAFNADSYYNTSNPNNIFVLKMASEGGLKWCSMMGGEKYDRIISLDFDFDNNIFVGGATSSHNFPLLNVTTDKILDTYSSFLIKYSPTGSIQWSNYYEGIVFEDFQVKNNQILALGENYIEMDCMIWKFSTTSQLVYNGSIGGSNFDSGKSIAISLENGFVFVGDTYSKDFPVMNAYDSDLNGRKDIFICRFNDADLLQWGTYFGGSGDEYYGFW